MKENLIKILQKHNVSDADQCAEEIFELLKKRTPKYTIEDEAQFNEFRVLFGGTKRGNKTEFENFVNKHKDWREALRVLKIAIVKEIAHRKLKKERNEFVPEWKNMQTWINNRCWEIEYNLPQEANSNPTYEELLKDLLMFPDHTVTKCGRYIKIGNQAREI
jgi:hypothetical protein